MRIDRLDDNTGNVFDLARERARRAPQLPVMTLGQALALDPPDWDYVLPALPVGKIGIISGAGGTGKSFWMLQAALQVSASGCCDFDLSGAEMDGGPEKIGSVLIVSLEDESEDLARRLSAIRDYYAKKDPAAAAWIDACADEGLVVMLPWAGHGITLFDEDCRPLPALDVLRARAAAMPRLRLIMIDTLRRAHDADENCNGEMSRVLRHFEKIARELGCAVVLLHHESKSAARDSSAGSSAIRGASSIEANCRWVMRMQVLLGDDAEATGGMSGWVRVQVPKPNYGPRPPDRWLKRVENGVLARVEPPGAGGSVRVGGAAPVPKKRGKI